MPTLSLVDRIDTLLPQTQCSRCGYEGCRPYANAIANGEAAINRCPPGGEAGVQALADLLNVPPLPLDASCGPTLPFSVAIIEETHCIGCTRCIDACPVDAIIGTAKRMHTILDVYCTGCEHCLPACPVDCITLVPANRTWTANDAHQARERYHRHQQRLLSTSTQNAPTSASPSPATDTPPQPSSAALSTQDAHKSAMIEAARARARARRTAPPTR